MRYKCLTVLIITFFLLVISGCANYYMVKDPASGSVYYTTDIQEVHGGAIKFTDNFTKSSVTLQNSELKEISKEEYKNGLKAK